MWYRLFSCCCARVDLSWVFRTVCDCYAKHFRCDNQCLTNALVQDSLFYSIGVVSFVHWSTWKLLTLILSISLETCWRSSQDLSICKRLVGWSFFRWCVGKFTWCNVWASCYCIWITWRAIGCKSLADSFTTTDFYSSSCAAFVAASERVTTTMVLQATLPQVSFPDSG